MNRLEGFCRALSAWLAAATILAASGVAEAGDCLGPCALAASKDGRVLFVAAGEAGQILYVDLQSRAVAAAWDLPAKPTGMALSPDGGKLYVTCGGAEGNVLVINAATGRILAAMPVGHGAMAPSVTPDGRRLFVCNRFDNDVSVMDLEAGREVARVPVSREPVASAITPDGRSLVVANHLPTDPSNSFFVTPVVTVIDVRTRETMSIRLPNGSTGLRDVCVSPDGRQAYVTHTLANYELVPASVVGGWTNTNVMSIVDTVEKRLVYTAKLDDMYLGAANPWGVGCSADGRWICVAHAGTGELSVIDREALVQKLARRGRVAPPVGGIPYSPSILAEFRQRVKLAASGPRELVVVGSRAYVAGYFSDTLDVVELGAKGVDQVGTIALGAEPRPSLRRRGEMLFNDATICYQHWQSCASCHPDARADGLNWDLLNDGVGNPKNTRSMLLAHATPPAMSWGVRLTAEAAVRSGLEHILFAARPEEDAAAIDEYLKSLEPAASPHLVGGGLVLAALRGKRLFESHRIGCQRCHPPPLYTDLLRHDVGTQGPYDFQARFDTPTLIEAWRTAPYLHDGRYTTVKELIAEGKHGSTAGQVDGLSEQELDDLVEFVLSL
jgi:YVTN family beta-propeller protein